ncbi:Putative membrane protein [hydrothermal vent metagenome]|uniref:Putative membrane protein n=1 Tax=hydrothermal vent metagenome TaxID=652676 RepID=A0A1W1BG09_9ZZZZ
MSYSYIKPQKKSPLTKEAILILTFFSIALFLLISTFGFLKFKEYHFKQELQTIYEKKNQLKTSIAKMQKSIAFINKESALANNIYTTNSVLKESIANLFDLVPDSITLSKAQILKNGLILYGVTPNRDIYTYMLEAPLRSIFTKTHTSFYQLPNGWLRFVSTNYLDAEFQDLLNEN